MPAGAGNGLMHRTRTMTKRVRPGHIALLCGCLLVSAMTTTNAEDRPAAAGTDQRVAELLGRMTVAEKIGQMTQVNGAGGSIPDELAEAVKAGRIGSILNEVDVDTVNRLQRLAVEESPNGIPLLMGRDVIHGFKTVLPIPLGQAATWNPDLVERVGRIESEAAVECQRFAVVGHRLDGGRVDLAARLRAAGPAHGPVPGVVLEEAIKIGLSAGEGTSVVVSAEGADLNRCRHASVPEGLPSEPGARRASRDRGRPAQAHS